MLADTKELVSAKVSEARDAVSHTVSSAKDSVATRVAGAVDMTRGAVQSGMDMTKSAVTSGVQSVMGSRVGQMVLSGAETVLGRSEAWADNHLPMTNAELGECCRSGVTCCHWWSLIPAVPSGHLSCIPATCLPHSSHQRAM